MSRWSVVLSLIICAVSVSPRTRAQDTGGVPRGTYVLVPPSPEAPRSLRDGQFRTLYLNRHGATFTSGNDNSSADTTSIGYGGTVPPFHLDDEAWAELMRCMRLQYGHYGINITDVDPGDAPHIEVAIGGHPGDMGLPSSVGGISPFSYTCSVIERAIVFVFAAGYGDRVADICAVAAQESGHAFGMDHEFLCEDPMTYLNGCGPKYFQDKWVPCGEYEPRTCVCGTPQQNSVAHLTDVLGPGETVPPVVTITEPADDATPLGGFAVKANVSDDTIVATVELWVDGKLVTNDESEPYTFATRQDLPPGAHEIKVSATDAAGNEGSDTVTVTVKAECGDTGSPACPEGKTCSAYRCVGALGSLCLDHADCASGLCGVRDNARICSQSCESGGAACPSGFVCAQDEGSTFGSCWPGGSDDSGCRLSGSARTGGGFLIAILTGIVLAGVGAARRRRRGA